MATGRMKGNRGPGGIQLEPLPLRLPTPELPEPLPLDGGPPVGKPPHRRSRLPYLVAAALLLLLIPAVILALVLAAGSDDDEVNGPGQPVERSITPSPAATETPTTVPTASPTNTPTQTATVSASPSPGTTVAGTRTGSPSTATQTPTVAAATGAPLERQRYVVRPGDSCEAMRIAFRFPAADWQRFQVALGRLSGRTPATQCVFSPGDVVCIPAAADLLNPAVLNRDDRCLAGQ